MKTHHGKAPLLARLRAVSSPVDTVPPAFKSLAQWAKEWGVHLHTARALLRRGVAARLMTLKHFRVRSPDCGRTYKVAHYAER
jgi:hypothetical protein